ncbi:MAG: hypothetical protein ACJ8AT_15920 [Hyalangium sp.]|uniref:hypothetical protein n=1 Tax=Hyalangium sp. TaxID=2028555 RepID=UPI00389A76B5
MKFGAGWLSAGVAALLLTAGCKEGKLVNEQATDAQSAEQAQQQPQQTQQTVAQAQPSALEAQSQQQSELAQQNQQAAQQPQQGAQAQQQGAQAPASSAQAEGEQTVVGQVLTANNQEVLVSSRGEPQVRLQLKPETMIMVDGRQARAVDIEEGSQVRASFNTQSGEPTATRIEVTTSQRPPTPAAPESGESSPGAHEPGDQEAPFQPDQPGSGR